MPYDAYENELKSVLSKFKVGQNLTALLESGEKKSLQIESISYEADYYEDNFTFKGGDQSSEGRMGLISTAPEQIKFIKSKDVQLNPVVSEKLKKQAVLLYEDALKDRPVEEGRGPVELKTPIVKQPAALPDYLTVVFPSLIKYENHTDDRGSFFFIYSLKDSKIIVEYFGHPEWASASTRVIQIKPILFFTIGNNPTVYFFGEHNLAWESTGHGIFSLSTGKLLLPTY